MGKRVHAIHCDRRIRRQLVERSTSGPKLRDEVGDCGSVFKPYFQLARADKVTVAGEEECADGNGHVHDKPWEKAGPQIAATV